jgi:hypothetical protein
MSTINAVQITIERPEIIDIPAESHVDSTMEDHVTARFLGSLQEDNPTHFVVELRVAMGYHAEEPSVDPEDNSRINIDIKGVDRIGSGTLIYLIADTDATEDWEFDLSITVNPIMANQRKVTYKFKKKRGR